VPRDATPTRDLLIDAGRRLFAELGAFRAPLKQVVEAAGQRNTSALHYHFGSREGLLTAIIEHHNETIEAERERLLDELNVAGRGGDLRALVAAVVIPFSRLLADDDGRQFLAIVAQLADLFDRWNVPSERTPAQALRAFLAIESVLDPSLGADLRHERVTRFLELVTEALGGRARALSRGRRPALSTDAFVANLIDMAVGALSAPSSV
jgi:TetR/AcrR family transcriptional regulator, regulator of cefoperazone and chloramphenicol sensitivity